MGSSPDTDIDPQCQSSSKRSKGHLGLLKHVHSCDIKKFVV